MIKFGTGGFRGIIGESITKESVQIVAQALANIAIKDGKTTPIAVGYDTRFLSENLARWVCEVFAANRITALLYSRAVPTPTVMYTTKSMGNEFGVMISASHNPYLFNGVKIFLKNGVDADAAFTDRLEEEAGKVTACKRYTYSEHSDYIKMFDNVEDYITNIKKFIHLDDSKKEKARVLFDNMHGVGIVGLEPLASFFGFASFEAINTARDAFFGFTLPNPIEEGLSHLRERVRAEKVDFAVATDCDADRLGAIDENGNYIDSNIILACIFYYLVMYRGMRGDAVKNISTSVLMDKLCERFGVKCHTVDVGFKNISAKMVETNALIGGESSGGLTVRGYLHGKDSVFAAALFSEMRIMMDKPVSQIVFEVLHFADYHMCTYEKALTVADLSVFDALATGDIPLGGVKDRVVLNNNVKYLMDGDCWVNVRCSGTEPVLRLVAEMDSKSKAVEVVNTIKEYILCRSRLN